MEQKEQIIIKIANEMLNSLNITQLVQIARDYSLVRAEDYYGNLSKEERKELEEKLAAEVAAATGEKPEGEKEPHAPATKSAMTQES